MNREDHVNCPWCGKPCRVVSIQNTKFWMCLNYGWGCEYKREHNPIPFEYKEPVKPMVAPQPCNH